MADLEILKRFVRIFSKFLPFENEQSTTATRNPLVLKNICHLQFGGMSYALRERGTGKSCIVKFVEDVWSTKTLIELIRSDFLQSFSN